MTALRSIVLAVLLRWILGIVTFGVLLFLPAGTWRYWEAWAYMGVLFIPMVLVLVYFLRRDPAVLERRMKMKESEPAQRWVIGLASVVFVSGFLTAGLDQRFGWSEVPMPLVVASVVLVLLGYFLFFLVLRENGYAARVIEVEQGQPVISTGPYAVVRHPMYSAVVLMYLSTPTALGSYWALVPFVWLVPLLAARIRNEEQVLREQLPGYSEYCEKVRDRLVPGVW